MAISALGIIGFLRVDVSRVALDPSGSCIAMTRQNRGPGVVDLLEVIDTPTEVCFVTQLMAGKDLVSFLSGSPVAVAADSTGGAH